MWTVTIRPLVNFSKKFQFWFCTVVLHAQLRNFWVKEISNLLRTTFGVDCSQRGGHTLTGGFKERQETVQEAGCDRGWQGGCHQVRFPLSLCISRVSPGWSGTTGPLLPTFSQLSHEVAAEDKVCESHTVQARHVGYMRRHSVVCATAACEFWHHPLVKAKAQAGVGRQEMMWCWI